MNIKNIVLGSLAITLLALVATVMPFLGVLLAGIPVILLVIYKNGRIHDSLASFGVAIVMIHFIFGVFNSGFILIYTMVNTFVLAYIDQEQSTPIKSQILLSGASLLAISLMLYILNVLTGVHVTEFFRDGFLNSKEAMDALNIVEEADMSLEMLINQVLAIIPFIMVFISALNGILIYQFYRLASKRFEFKVSPMGKFSKFQLPMHFIYGITFILFLSYVFGLTNFVDFDTISLNIILMLVYIFALQGIAILFYYLDQKHVNNILKGVILCVLILFQAIFILAIIGWLDMIFDFRKIKGKKDLDT